jgi:glucose-1-phosphate thymidylyltransferase
MRGIVLAGGSGSRLFPTTFVSNKHLLSIFDKPMVYYPIATLMTAGIRDIAIISSPNSINLYSDLLGDGSKLGINLSYLIQVKPEGIAQAFLIAEDFIENNKSALILGDNLFHGSGLGRDLSTNTLVEGAKIFAYPIANPVDYGVVEINDLGQVLSIEEKPKLPKSNLAVTGLYFYDNTAVARVKELVPSERGELEITSLNQSYNSDHKLIVKILGRGTTWLDTGTPKQLNDAGNYVRVMQERQGSYIACLEEISLIQNWISDQELSKSIQKHKNSDYGDYLGKLAIRHNYENK